MEYPRSSFEMMTLLTEMLDYNSIKDYILKLFVRCQKLLWQASRVKEEFSPFAKSLLTISDIFSEFFLECIIVTWYSNKYG